MADASLGTAVLRTKLDASGLKTGLQQAEAETKKFAGTASEAIKSIGAGFAGIVASRGLRSYLGFMRESATVAQQAATSAALYEKALRRNNIAVDEGRALVKRLADQFGVTNSVVEESATFLLRQGASLDTVDKALVTAGASAAAAGFDIATAFGNVSTAVATGNSALLKTSGIVTTLGKAEQDYAKSVGKTVDNLTQEERIQARVAAIYKETASEIEDVDILLKGLPKSQADVNKELTTFRQTAGDLALKVLVPLNEGFAGALRLVNGLPTPIKNAAIAMAGMATAATTLAAGFIAIKAALPALSGLGLASFGPAGWVVLGVTAVAGLAAALSGGKGSLDDSAKKAAEAFNKGDANSLTGALDGVISKFDGDFKDSLVRAQDELKETGRVGIESANNIARAYHSALAQASLTQGAGLFGMFQPVKASLRQAGASMFGDRAIQDADKLVEAALKAGNLQQALVTVNDVLLLLKDMPSTARDSLQEFRNELVDAMNAVAVAEFKPFVPSPTTAPPPGGGGGAGTGVAARTWDDVLAELDKAGTEAMRRAAFEGTPAAYREAAQKRVGLIDNAITEALTEFHGQVSASDLAALRARRDAAALQAREPVPAAAPPDPAARAALRAQAEAIMADTMQAMSDAAEVDRQARVAGHREALTINADLRRQALAIMADTAQAQADARAAEDAQRAYIDSLADSGDELGRWLTTANNLTATIKAANDETARMSVFAGALKKYGSGREGLTGTTAADRTGPSLTGRDGAAAIARDTVEAVAQAYRDGNASIDDVRTAVDALTTLTPMSVKAINELTGGLFELAIEADRAAQKAAALAEFESNPGLYGMRDMPIVKDFGEKFVRESRSWLDEALGGAGKGRSPGFDRDSVSSFKRGVDDSANAFRDTIINAGIGFADTLVQGIQSGDLGSIIKGGFGAGGNILGSLVGGPWGMVIGGLLPILGGLFGGLFGGDRDTETRRREEQQRARSVPAININFNVQQTNNYAGGPRQPENELAFSRQADSLFESFYTRVLSPRLDRIERAAGLATGA